MLWLYMVCRVRMERNGKWHLWPFHAHTTHRIKPKKSSTLHMMFFKIYSFDCVEVRRKKAQKCFGHTRVLAVSWL